MWGEGAWEYDTWQSAIIPSFSSSSLEELREEVEGCEGAGDRREEGSPPRGAVERLRGPWLPPDMPPAPKDEPLEPPSLKGNLLVMTGMAEWGWGVCGVWGVGSPGILSDEDDEEEDEEGISVECSRISAVDLITP